MAKVRLKFSKIKEGSLISHLDLTRLFTRALTRAKVKAKFTAGFNPHLFLVFTPPLSLGYESLCELADFETEEPSVDYSQLKEKITAVLPRGIEVIDCYEPVLKFKDIAYGRFLIKIENNEKITDEDIEKIDSLFKVPVVEVLKKSKKGETTINIIEKTKNFKVSPTDDFSILIDVLLSSAPDDLVNPEYVVKAIERHLDFECGFVTYQRVEFYTKDLTFFV